MQRNTEGEEQLERLRRRYQGRGKEGNSRRLDEFCEQHGYERKYAIKLLQGVRGSGPKHAPPGPEPRYEGVSEVVTRVWKAAEQLCGKRLVQALPLWLPHYERHYEKILPRQKKLLAEISAATLDRLLTQQKAQKSSSTKRPRRSARLSSRPPVLSQPRPRSSGART